MRSKPWQSVFRQIDFKDATVILKDGGANTLTVKLGEGNVTWSERKERKYIPDRGNLDDVQDGDDVPMDLSIEAVFEYLKGAANTTTTPSVEDVLKNINEAAAWVSSDSDTCRPFAVDVEIRIVPSCATADQEYILFPDFRFETLDHDMNEGTISISGRCNATTPTITRNDQS